MKGLQILPDEAIKNKIFVIRGIKVMIDRDLADLYGIETKRLKEQVKRNLKRFPEDFMFVLNRNELSYLRSQIATSNRGGSRYYPMAFTEQGVAMLSSVLNSDRAISVNIQIIRVFTKIRQMFEAHQEILKKLEALELKDIEQDEKIALVFECLRQLEQGREEESKFRGRRRIGFKTSQKKE